MHDISIRDFAGIARADIPLQPGKISWIVGKNFQGKSSIKMALAAILSNNKTPNGQPSTTGAINLVKLGTDEANVKLVDDAGEIVSQMEWRQSGVTQKGEAPKPIGLSATGMAKLSAQTTENAAKMLAKLLGTNPTDAETLAAINSATEETMSKEDFDNLWASLSTLGWDATAKKEEEKQRTYKAQWTAVTGKSRFVDDGLDWKPEGWNKDFSKLNIAVLEAEKVAHEEHYRKSLQAEAVNDAEYERLKAEAEPLKGLEPIVADLKHKLDSAQNDLSCAKALLNSVPPPPKPGAKEDTHPCPLCKGELAIRGGKPYAPRIAATADPAVEKEQQAQHDQQAVRVKDVQEALNYAQAVYDSKNSELRSAKRAAEKFAQLETAPKAEKPAKAAAEYQKEIAATAAKIKMIADKTKADAAFKKAQKQIKLVDLLKPDGLRQRKLIERLGYFNKEVLMPLCDTTAIPTTAAWGAVAVRPDMVITYETPEGGVRAYVDISESEQWRADAIIQIALAKLQGDHIILMDSADRLDAPARSQLLKLLSTNRIGAAVFMMCNKIDDVPDLAAKKLGATFWVERGICKPVGELVTA